MIDLKDVITLPKLKRVTDKLKLILGNSDISGVGDGTITGGISELNSNLTSVYPTVESVEGWDIIKIGNFCICSRLVDGSMILSYPVTFASSPTYSITCSATASASPVVLNVSTTSAKVDPNWGSATKCTVQVMFIGLVG